MGPRQIIISLAVISSVVQAQRPFYAGFQSIGFPEAHEEIPNRASENGSVPPDESSNQNNTQSNRLPNNQDSGQGDNLNNGHIDYHLKNDDREFLDSLNKAPISTGPAWLVNWSEYKDLKMKTWPQKPRGFADK